MAESSWIDSNPRNFVPGDIICNTEDQSHLRIVIYTSKEALLVSSIVHCALTEVSKEHPIYPIFFEEIPPKSLLKLGNLKDFSEFLERESVRDEIRKNGWGRFLDV